MNLVGYVMQQGVQYPLAFTSFNKSSHMWLLLQPSLNYVPILQGETIKASDVIQMLDLGQQKKIGETFFLKKVLQELSDFKEACIQNHKPIIIGESKQYKDAENNSLHTKGINYGYVNYNKSKSGDMVIVLEPCHSFSIDKKGIRKIFEKMESRNTMAKKKSATNLAIPEEEDNTFDFPGYIPVDNDSRLNRKQSKNIFCPYCFKTVFKKNGHYLNGKQRYMCLNEECTKKTFPECFTYNAHDPKVKRAMYEYVEDGMGTRVTARILDISKDTVTSAKQHF